MTVSAALPTFSAVLLAGGQSRRMGRDKAMLPVPGGGLLWERQVDLLKSLGPTELFISGPVRPGFPGEIRVLADERSGLGPLSGIFAALEAMRTPLLVVLAVDLPEMSAAFLRALLARSREEMGVVPRWAGQDGFYEPLAAIYPRSCLEVARERLTEEDFAVQGFVRACEALLQSHTIEPCEASLFANWNEP